MKTTRAYYGECCDSRASQYWKTAVTQGAYIDPPPDTQAPDPISDDDRDDSINLPDMRDTNMTEVVGRKHELLPKEAHKRGADIDPVCMVKPRAEGRQQGAAGDFWAVAGEVSALVETRVLDALVENFVSSGVLGLSLERQVGRRWFDICAGGLKDIAWTEFVLHK